MAAGYQRRDNQTRLALSNPQGRQTSPCHGPRPILTCELDAASDQQCRISSHSCHSTQWLTGCNDHVISLSNQALCTTPFGRVHGCGASLLVAEAAAKANPPCAVFLADCCGAASQCIALIRVTVTMCQAPATYWHAPAVVRLSIHRPAPVKYWRGLHAAHCRTITCT
jgi:hypothetical protein